jgi:hypothetical protein
MCWRSGKGYAAAARRCDVKSERKLGVDFALVRPLRLIYFSEVPRCFSEGTLCQSI